MMPRALPIDPKFARGSPVTARWTELRPELKVLFTSGYAESQLGTPGVLSDGSNFIHKPYTSRAARESCWTRGL